MRRVGDRLRAHTRVALSLQASLRTQVSRGEYAIVGGYRTVVGHRGLRLGLGLGLARVALSLNASLRPQVNRGVRYSRRVSYSGEGMIQLAGILLEGGIVQEEGMRSPLR